ncbi:MAG: sugar ABC transporter permease [Ruminococcaceae bacterium]|nr:sugar ABC transporter permease [Oscillospiraceae bacterium]MBO4972995.1 sugar ABC transporter permease [Clostridia bacterium]
MAKDVKKNTKAEIAAPKKTKKRKIVSLDKKKARAGWFFVLPFIIGCILIYIPVIFDSFIYSVSEVENIRGGGYELHFVGIENYRAAFFDDPNFAQTLVKGLQQLIFDVPAIVIFSLFMAVLLNQKMMGRAFFRAVFFVPVILSTGLMESIEAIDISEEVEMGEGEKSATAEIVSAMDIEVLFSYMKIGTGLVEYVTQLINSIYNIVNRSGVQMLIFLSGLQSISPAIYEACSIDGASGWETFWKVTFPMISPMILVNGVYTIIDSFTSESNLVMTYINGVYGSGSNGNVLSTAMAWTYFTIVILIISAVAALFSAYVFYQRRDS